MANVYVNHVANVYVNHVANEYQKQLFCVIELIENIFCIKI